MRALYSFFTMLLVWSFAGCAPTEPLIETDVMIQAPPARSARGARFAVSSSHPYATEAAIEVLEEGGNAIDAAVAASFVMAVVQPHSTGIGGGGFLLHFDAHDKQVQAFDFRERAPLLAHAHMYVDKPVSASRAGHLASGVPGLVKGLAKVHERFGTLSMSRLLRPAIRYAEEGFEVSDALANAFRAKEELLRAYPATMKVFLPEGNLLREGQVLRQADLAQTLKGLSQGSDSFYKGGIAETIESEMRRHDGILSQKDLASYKVKEREPIVAEIAGNRFFAMPLPSSGVIVLEALQLYNSFSPSERSSPEERLTLHTEVLNQVFRDRACLLGDPDFEPASSVDVAKLLGNTHLNELRRALTSSGTPSLKCDAPQFHESDSTVHLVVVDGKGNAVSSTQTINTWFGSGVVIPGTGILMNNEMDDFVPRPHEVNTYGLPGTEANWIQPRKTMLSSMSPTIVCDGAGELRAVVGAPGGPRIVSAVYQTLANLILDTLDAETSVFSPRVHHQWLPQVAIVEEAAGAKVIRRLKANGHAVARAERGIARIELIAREGERWHAVSDWRSEGAAAAR